MNFSSIFSRRFLLLGVTLVCFSIFSISIFVSAASAAIDPSTIVGMWLFDEGTGKVATDASENGLDGDLNIG